MLRGLQMGELDLAIAVAKAEPSIPSRHLWTDPGGMGAVRGHADRSASAGAADLVRRGLLLPVHRRAGAQPCRAQLRVRIYVAQHCRPGGGGHRRHGRDGAAAQPGRRHALVDLGGRAAALRCPTSIAESFCAKAATGRRSRSLPTRSARPCARGSPRPKTNPSPCGRGCWARADLDRRWRARAVSAIGYW